MKKATLIIGGIFLLMWIRGNFVNPSPETQVQTQVRYYLKEFYLKDPDSYESVDWSDIRKTDNGYCVTHKYREKNIFGAYVTEYKTFYLKDEFIITAVY